MANPFSTTFGIEPLNFIQRETEAQTIFESFDDSFPSNSVYLLLGPRGSGKTVLMSSICEHYSSKDDRIVIDIGAKQNIIEKICSLLYEKGKLKNFFLKAEINFSFQGFSFSLKGKEPISSAFALLIKMLDILKKKNKKVLFAIDEVDNSDELKYFISDYQQLLRNKYSVYLLMTGLYENISKLQNNQSITFLYRSPKIFLNPLPLKEMAYGYQKYLNVSLEDSVKFAKFTKGYAYAYQLLGYLLFNKEKKIIDNDLLKKFDDTLSMNAYDKIFSELSEKEQLILKEINSNKEVKTSSIMEKINMDTKTFSVYRDKLIKKGIIKGTHYGKIEFSLPRFKEFLYFK